MRIAGALAAILLSIAFPLRAQTPLADDGDCDLNLKNATGPVDYRIATQDFKDLVEKLHFTDLVEGLVRGAGGSLVSDIDYTLRVFPNHPRALLAMARLAQREKKQTPAGSHHSVDCWFKRGIAFQPDDWEVRQAYGIELLRAGKKAEGIEQLNTAHQLLGRDSANIHYNLGLAYFDTQEYDKSLDHARKAYELGFPLPGLRDKLKRAGKWQ